MTDGLMRRMRGHGSPLHHWVYQHTRRWPRLNARYLTVRAALRARLRARKLQRGYRHLAHVIIAHKDAQRP